MTAPAQGVRRLEAGGIEVARRACHHRPPSRVSPWVGEPDTSGRVVVVGAGKMGLSLVAQYVSHGWSVTAADINPAVVDGINAGRSHIGAEPEVSDLISTGVADGRLRATTDVAAAAADADVIVVIVPVLVNRDGTADRRAMDAAVASIARGVRPGTLVILETTLPVGDTRDRYATLIETESGLPVERGGEEAVLLAFSPERLSSGFALLNLATYPKVVGGVGDRSTTRARAFYEAVLDAPVMVLSSSEAAEFSKLAETTYRDVNIALANELARYADRVGVDALEAFGAANSQPYSHLHSPGIGVGGHCIPVYPRFVLAAAPDLALVALAREINDGQAVRAVRIVEDAIGPLSGQAVLVLGLTYRHGVHELAYSRGVALIALLRDAGAVVLAHDPLLTDDEVAALGATPWTWATPRADVRALITQTGDPGFDALDQAWFPSLAVVVDGRNSLRPDLFDDRVEVHGFGRSPRRT